MISKLTVVWVRGLPCQLYLSITKWPDTARRLDLYQKKQKSMIGLVLRMILSSCRISFHLDLWIDLINIDYDLCWVWLVYIYSDFPQWLVYHVSTQHPNNENISGESSIFAFVWVWNDDKIFNWTWYQFNAPTQLCLCIFDWYYDNFVLLCVIQISNPTFLSRSPTPRFDCLLTMAKLNSEQ